MARDMVTTPILARQIRRGSPEVFSDFQISNHVSSSKAAGLCHRDQVKKETSHGVAESSWRF